MKRHTAELFGEGCQAGSVQHLALIQQHLLCYGEQDHRLGALLAEGGGGGGWLACARGS